MYSSYGTLKYSPTLNGSLERRDGGTTKWWAIVECDPELGRYYRYVYHLDRYRTESLRPPIWKTHISVIRDEKPVHEDLWNKWQDFPIPFTYEPCWCSNGIYVWLAVHSPALVRIREELGLPSHPEIPLHMTVGNLETA